MRNSLSKLAIRCLETDAKYTLQFEGADWSETHPTIEAAILRAGEIVVEETTLLIYDIHGQPVVTTTLHPLPGDGGVRE